MDKEIDELFLDSEARVIDQNKIRNLEECMKSLPRIHPNLRQVQSKCREIHSSLELYTIKLESLANELKEIEAENVKLENEVLYQTDIYNHLKDLLVSIEIKEDHFVALESESFESVEGLCKIEKALDILNSFDVEEYDIRIVREKRERVNNALRAFYKRFVTHMGKFLIRSDSTGELKVHKGLYGVIKRFKAIFNHSRRYKDYHAVICSIYIAHSKRLYEREFDFHLKTVLRLLKGSPTRENIDTSLSVLFESYRSIIRCEDRFLESMEIEEGLDTMFSNVKLLISDFIEDVYDLADVETLGSLKKSWKDIDPREEGVYHDFQESIKKLWGELETGYLDRERSRMGEEEGVERLEGLLKRSDDEDLSRELVLINIGRITKGPEDSDLKDTIRRWRLIHRIGIIHAREMEEISRAEEDAEMAFEKRCTGFVLGDDEAATMGNLKRLLSLVGGDRSFKDKAIRKTREIVLENIEEDQREEASSLLTRALNS